jgi:hypothetical protein
MKAGWCLDCHYYAMLIAGRCKDCDPLAHDDNVAVILRIEEVGDE